MCGITGFLSSGFDLSHLKRMTKSLAHRGPDADGFFFDPDQQIGLGHRRLSILDLSESANQPFYSSDGRYVMVFNGEVYNFNEIRKGITDHSWKTNGDTEVIVEAFARWGLEAISKFNGMFALAIWDRNQSELTLIRDRIGIKPLYYYHDGEKLIFASELKAIKSLIKKELLVSKSSVQSLLHLGYLPGISTMYTKVKKVAPGGVLRIKGGSISHETFWSPDTGISNQTIFSEKGAEETLEDLIVDAVQKRMISDVPVGTFLSGGIDSSIVTSVAQRYSSKPIKTFSIGFKEQSYDESVYAEKVAKHLKTDHQTILLSQQDALEKVVDLTSWYDEPFADSSAIPTYLVSQMARESVKVALSGDGGDEQFMGYGMYRWANHLNKQWVRAGRSYAKSFLGLGSSRYQRIARMFDFDSSTNLKSHIFSQEQYFFSERELMKLMNEFERIPTNDTILNRELSPAENQSFYDLCQYLPDDLLHKVDIASMKNSLEVRVPLLDHRIVEFSLNLDERLKVRGSVSKYLLKKILFKYVPQSYFDRPKWGFSIPMSTWLKQELRYLIDDYLNEEIVSTAGFVSVNLVQKLKEDFLGGTNYLYNRLWVLIQLHKWWKEEY